jgi:hypothetical protein
VPFDKAGYRKFPSKFDYLRLRANEILDLVIAPDGDDPIATRGQRLGQGALIINGHDLTAAQHHVSRLLVGNRTRWFDTHKDGCGNDCV